MTDHQATTQRRPSGDDPILARAERVLERVEARPWLYVDLQVGLSPAQRVDQDRAILALVFEGRVRAYRNRRGQRAVAAGHGYRPVHPLTKEIVRDAGSLPDLPAGHD